MSHNYLSTACLHSLHDRCILTCKFCASPCLCTCHIDDSVAAMGEQYLLGLITGAISRARSRYESPRDLDIASVIIEVLHEIPPSGK